MANGTTTTCTNNIVVFAIIALYESTIENLETQIEAHNNSFDQLTIAMTNEQADEYADSIGFDEDKPLTDFENQYNFCSLRKKINTLESQWLEQQGDGNWNLEYNPDSYYVDDDVERTLLNEQSEVLIGTCETGYILYKFYNWGHIQLPLSNLTDLTNVLTQLNNGNYPLVLPINIYGSSLNTVTQILNNSPYDCSAQPLVECPTVIYTEPTNSPANSCQDKIKEKGENIFNSGRRILWKHKFIKLSNFITGGKVTRIKSVTKSFKKKNGKWKKFRTSIAAGVTGAAYEDCTGEKAINEEKQKRRKRVKIKVELAEPVSQYSQYQKNKVRPNSLFSIHKQESNVYQKEIYQY